MLPTRNYSATDTAITQRPTSTAILAIDSEDRYANMADSREVETTYANVNELVATGVKINNTPYLFTIEKASSLNNGFFTRLGVSEINLPWTIPNINNKTNTMLFITVPPATPAAITQITFPNNFYTPAQLAAAVQLVVRAIHPSLAGFTMVYNASSRFEYATNSAALIGFSPLLPNSSSYPFGPQARQLFDLMGMNSTNLTPAVSGVSGVTLAQAIRYVDIVCSQLTYNQALKDTMSQPIARNVLCRVYVSDPGSMSSTVAASSATFCPPGCAPMTIYRDFSQPKQIAWLPNQPITGSLVFEVYDDQGDNLALSDPATLSSDNKADWSMTILCTEN
jgi:hypothetical protein